MLPHGHPKPTPHQSRYFHFFPVPRLCHANVTSVVTSDTRRLRYSSIDHSDVNAVNHIGLNIYEQEVLRVIDHEKNIQRITKWNGSEISEDLVENTDTPQKLHWIQSGFIDSGLSLDDIMEKFGKDCEVGVHYEYLQSKDLEDILQRV